MTPLRKRMMEELQGRNYSPGYGAGIPRRRGAVCEVFRQIAGTVGTRAGPAVSAASAEHNRATGSTVQLYRSALRFLYANTLKTTVVRFCRSLESRGDRCSQQS